MTPDQITALRALASRATPGPWRRAEHSERFVEAVDAPEAVAKAYRVEDTEYLAALAPEVVIGLLDEIEALRGTHALHWVPAWSDDDAVVREHSSRSTACGLRLVGQRCAARLATSDRDFACSPDGRCKRCWRAWEAL